MFLSTSESRVRVRMENSFVPVSYKLSISVDLQNWSYEAEEKVVLHRNPRVPQRNIIQLHAAPSMEISSITGASMVKRNAIKESIYLQLPTEIANDDTATPELGFKFKHRIQDELRGFYKVKYRTNGAECRMASTHFEPTAARFFFICQDEPAQRADFTLQVKLPTGNPESELYTVLSNTPLASKYTDGDFIVHDFQPIQRCPPYLLACVVGQLECISTTAGQNGIPVSVYTTSDDKRSRSQFALDTSAFALQFFEEFFQYPFPLPKLDIVAVPDFPIGGMENWGCICCAESILVDENASSILSRKRASELLCHEVSHNWFGNLVGIDWWEGLWLKEGFASWCGYYASHVRNPSWKCLDDGLRSVSGAKEMDQYDYTHPVEVPIYDPSDITQIFDRISYDKGMGLVFMLESFLGVEKWAPAVAYYISTYSYNGTKTCQLWEALEESAAEPITEMMKGFATQPGFPLVHIERLDLDHVSLRQQPCRLATTVQKPRKLEVWRPKPKVDAEGAEGAAEGGAAAEEAAVPPPAVEAESGEGEAKPEEGEEKPKEEEEEMELVIEYEDTLWNIPVAIAGPEGKITSLVMEGKDPITVEANETEYPYMVVNPGCTGFYRCRYDDSLFKRLLEPDIYSQLSVNDRCALLSDVKAAIFMGLPDLNRLGTLSTVVRSQETERLVLQEFVSVLNSFTEAFNEGEVIDRVRRAQLSFFIPRAESYVTAEAQAQAQEDVELQMLHTFVIQTALNLIAAHYHASEARREPLFTWAMTQSKTCLSWVATGEEGAGFLRSTIGHCLALYNRLDVITTPATRQAQLLEVLKKVDGNDELTRAVLYALCSSTEPTYVEDLLRHSMMNTVVRSHFGGNVFAAAASNPSMKAGQLWNFMQVHFDHIKSQWGSGQFRIQMIVQLVASTLSGFASADEFERFFQHHPIPNARLAIYRAKESICIRTWLRQRWSPEDLLRAFDPNDL